MVELFLHPVIFLFAAVTNIWILELIKTVRPFRWFSEQVKSALYRVLAFLIPTAFIVLGDHFTEGLNLPYPVYITGLTAGLLSVLMYDFGGRNVIKYLKNRLFGTTLQYDEDDDDSSKKP